MNKQYTEKYHKRWFSIILTNIPITKYPVMKEEINPKISGQNNKELLNKLKFSINEAIYVKDNIGMASMNEKCVDFFLFTPKNIAAAIVIPDLDMPGIIAKHWAMPIKKASLYKILL